MILEEWNNDAFVTAWINTTGDQGDFYRKTLINPIIASVLQMPESALEEGVFHHALAKFHWASECPIDVKGRRVMDEKYGAWMEQFPARRKADGNQILDLGCGEGYRARWLAPKGYIYSGIDGSTKLIEHAKARTAGAQNVDFRILDLASDTGCDALVDLLRRKSCLPTVSFAVTLFDHLPASELVKLLRALTSCYDVQTRGHLVAVTCNPQFYRATPDTEKLIAAQIETLSNSESAGRGRVRMFHRSRTFYSQVFRDSGVAVLDCTTPMPLVNSSYDTDHDRGTGPLTFWLLRVGGVKRTPTAIGKKQTSIAKFRAFKPQPSAAALLTILKPKVVYHELRVQTGKAIVAAHNMGGRLFIVMEGLAALNKPPLPEIEASSPKEVPLAGDSALATKDFSPQIIFHPGDVFGDLELAAGGRVAERPTYYRQTVYAASGGQSNETVVLEIPANVAEELMLLGRGQLGYELFSQLRIRLQSQIWVQGARRISLSPDDCDIEYAPVWSSNKEVMPIHLQAVHFLACVLLGAWDKQRAELLRSTPAVNTVILQSHASALAHVGSVEKEAGLFAIRILADAGAVVGWPIDREFRKLLEEARAPQTIKPLIVGTSRVSQELQPLSEMLQVKKSAHFFVLEDLWLLRRLAAQPTEASFRLLAAAIYYQRHRQTLGRTHVARITDIAIRSGEDVSRRYAQLIIDLVNARIAANLASYDSLGIPL